MSASCSHICSWPDGVFSFSVSAYYVYAYYVYAYDWNTLRLASGHWIVLDNLSKLWQINMPDRCVQIFRLLKISHSNLPSERLQQAANTFLLKVIDTDFLMFKDFIKYFQSYGCFPPIQMRPQYPTAFCRLCKCTFRPYTHMREMI